MEVYNKYSQSIEPELIYMFMDYLNYSNIEFIVSPYEADAQLAFLYKQNYIDYIVSEDSDFFAFSCFKLIRKIQNEGQCQVFNENDEKNHYFNVFKELSEQQRTLLCVMSGCDYLQNLKGMAFVSLLS